MPIHTALRGAPLWRFGRLGEDERAFRRLRIPSCAFDYLPYSADGFACRGLEEEAWLEKRERAAR